MTWIADCNWFAIVEEIPVTEQSDIEPGVRQQPKRIHRVIIGNRPDPQPRCPNNTALKFGRNCIFMPVIKIYTKNFYTYCKAAKQLLGSKGHRFEEINVEGNLRLMQDIATPSGQRTMPQIFIGDHPVGGYHELRSITINGEFDSLLARLETGLSA
jgi:glutaredoxin 3